MSNLLPLLTFAGSHLGSGPAPTEHNKVIPDEFMIFCNTETNFLPEDKTFDDLTSEELQLLRHKYRFSPFKPGQYQALTGYPAMFH